MTETKQIPNFFVIFDTEKNAPIMNLLPSFLKEYWNVDNVPESGIIYAEVNHERAMNTNRLNGRLPFYTFTVIIEGQAVINYNGQNITLRQGDLYTYTPGFSLTVEHYSKLFGS